MGRSFRWYKFASLDTSYVPLPCSLPSTGLLYDRTNVVRLRLLEPFSFFLLHYAEYTTPRRLGESLFMSVSAERPFLRRKTSYSMSCRWVGKESVCWSTLRALEQVSRNLFWPMLAWISGCPSSSGSQPRQKSSRALVGHETTMKSEKSSRWRGTRAGPRARGFPHVSVPTGFSWRVSNASSTRRCLSSAACLIRRRRSGRA